MSLRQEIINEIKNMLNEAEESVDPSDQPIGQTRAMSWTDQLATDLLSKYKIDVNSPSWTDQLATQLTNQFKKSSPPPSWTDQLATQLTNKLKGKPPTWTDQLVTQLTNKYGGKRPTWLEQLATQLTNKVGTASKTTTAQTKRGLFDIGSRGPKVKEIQTILATQGYDDELRGNKAGQLNSSELAKLADGIFGQRTAASVKLFQKDNGMPQTGFVDQKTYEAIKKMGMGQNITTASTPAPVSDKIAGAPSSFRTGINKESKNWVDNTRESASTSLFERLVKDVSNKKVI